MSSRKPYSWSAVFATGWVCSHTDPEGGPCQHRWPKNKVSDSKTCEKCGCRKLVRTRRERLTHDREFVSGVLFEYSQQSLAYNETLKYLAGLIRANVLDAQVNKAERHVLTDRIPFYRATTRQVESKIPSYKALTYQLTAWRQADPERWSGLVSYQRAGVMEARKAFVARFGSIWKARARLSQNKIANRRAVKYNKTLKPGNKPRPMRGASRSVRNQAANNIADVSGMLRDLDTLSGRPVTLVCLYPPNVNKHGLRVFPGGLTAGRNVDADSVTGEERSFRLVENTPRLRPGTVFADRVFKLHISEDIIVEPLKPLTTADGLAVGVDYGVARTVSYSDGTIFDHPDTTGLVERSKLLQRGMKRHKQGSRRQAQLARRRKATQRKIRNRKQDAELQEAAARAKAHTLIVSEAVRSSEMSRSASGSVKHPGTNVAAKRGLNRGISGGCWGRIQQSYRQAAANHGTRYVEVAPAYTSVTCSRCGNTDPASRRSQAEFVCVACGFEANADMNAATVIMNKGLAQATAATGGPPEREKQAAGVVVGSSTKESATTTCSTPNGVGAGTADDLSSRRQVPALAGIH